MKLPREDERNTNKNCKLESIIPGVLLIVAFLIIAKVTSPTLTFTSGKKNTNVIKCIEVAYVKSKLKVWPGKYELFSLETGSDSLASQLLMENRAGLVEELVAAFRHARSINCRLICRRLLLIMGLFVPRLRGFRTRELSGRTRCKLNDCIGRDV
ncbi:hypothetical protein GWI33_016100 [Rhynchophorus ferrugineus]|uniref:Uncharacterized protein n=1 Tax=Rhynchophorus ferrugineus TaxID=354439 RepID=A0A834I296_RHYFE|nr:hypothetical protein GWI33_016100 [Rhynchophorus ferrugineus]